MGTFLFTFIIGAEIIIAFLYLVGYFADRKELKMLISQSEERERLENMPKVKRYVHGYCFEE
jgi:hypothetical protein